MERCKECGFGWDSVQRNEIGPRLGTGSSAIAELLIAEPVRSRQRPDDPRWSMVEYGAHVRDVLLTMRDRMVIGLVEDNPDFKPLYRDERVDLGLYQSDTAAVVAQELSSASGMFIRLFDAIDPAHLSRQVQFVFPAATRTLLWMGQQAVHEVEHHRADIEEDLRLVSGEH